MLTEFFLWLLLSGYLANLPASSIVQSPRLDEVDRSRGYMPPAVTESRAVVPTRRVS